MKYTGTMTRMQRDELPDAPMRCDLTAQCVYRTDGVCDEPRTNKGNSDSACHKMGNRAIYTLLTPNAGFGVFWPRERSETMNLQTWAEWMAQIEVLTGDGVAELRADPGKGMTISVLWTQDGRCMAYEHAMSFGEMERMYEVVQPCVLESITHAVRKMTPNAGIHRAAEGRPVE